MTDKLTCGRLSTCELCSRFLLAEMLFNLHARANLASSSIYELGGWTDYTL